MLFYLGYIECLMSSSGRGINDSYDGCRRRRVYDGYPEQCIVKKHGGNDRQSSTQEHDRLHKGIES